MELTVVGSFNMRGHMMHIELHESHLCCGVRIQSRCRFIQAKDTYISDQGKSNANTLRLTTCKADKMWVEVLRCIYGSKSGRGGRYGARAQKCMLGNVYSIRLRLQIPQQFEIRIDCI